MSSCRRYKTHQAHETLAKFRAKGPFLKKADRQLIHLDLSHEAEYEAENKHLQEALSKGIDSCNKAMWIQKKFASTAGATKADDDKKDRTVIVCPELRPDKLSHEATYYIQEEKSLKVYKYYNSRSLVVLHCLSRPYFTLEY